jgi:hypothetical protein
MARLADAGRSACATCLLVVGAAILSSCGIPAGEGDAVFREHTPHDLLAGGERVEIRSGVDGDVIAAAAEVVVAAPIEGYAIVAGRDVRLRESVANDAIAAGETVELDAAVADRAFLAGRTVHVRPEATIGAAWLAGSTVTVEGHVRDSLRINANEAHIGGIIDGHAEVNAARVTVLPGATVNGALIVRSAQPPDISPQARVLGAIDHRVPARPDAWGAWLGGWAFYTLAILVLGIATVALAPVWPARVAGLLAGRPAASAGLGIAALVGVPVVTVLLFVSAIGAPLAVVLAALYVASLILTAPFVAYWIGSSALRRRPTASAWSRMVAGVLVLALLMSLPWLGAPVQVAVATFGLGALLLERKRARHTLHREQPA